MYLMPKKVLIQTIPHDSHAVVVACELLKRGNEVFTWFSSAFPESHRVSIYFDKDVRFRTFVGNSALEGEPDVVWRRRFAPPRLPSIIAEEDQDFVRSEVAAVADSLGHLFPGAFFVNDQISATKAELKPLQLRLAVAEGLRIPPTLISNDPADVRDFIASRQSSCIYKPFVGHIWSDAAERRVTYTAEVSEDLLPSDKLLASCPGIFQEKVGKKFEVRAQFFGNYYAAIRINSRNLVDGDLDWRFGQNAITSCEAMTLPPNIELACRRLMRSLGIAVGGFDFIVDLEDQWIFLEVNEAGQFLFIEEWCSELTLLDAFCQFIEAGTPDFDYQPPKTPATLADTLTCADLKHVHDTMFT